MSPDATSDAVMGLLDRKKNRLIRVILGTKERLYPDDDDGMFRKVVLDEVNAFFEQVSEIVETLENDRTITVNQLFLDALDEVRQEVAALRTAS